MLFDKTTKKFKHLMNLWWSRKQDSYSLNYTDLISLLEKGEKNDIERLLWKPINGVISYLPITYEMILKLKRPIKSDTGLSIYKTFESDKYQLIIFNFPWSDSKIPYTPIIVDRVQEKLVGLMLPFNEISEYLTKKENKIITELGINWITIAMKFRFDI